MAKAKKFNIENFVEDAAEGVQVAHDQRIKEEEAKVEAERVQQQAAEVKQYPKGEEERIYLTPELPKQEDPQKGKRGRKKSLRTIERVNGKIVFLEKEMDVDLARLSTFERFDKQDIIRTALYQWLKQHFDGMMLDDSGRREVIEYIQRTTTFE